MSQLMSRSTGLVLLSTTLTPVLVVLFSIKPINLPSKSMTTRCLAREAVWHAAKDGVKEKGGAPFHSRQMMDCLRRQKYNWRNK